MEGLAVGYVSGILETFILSFIHYGHVPSLKVILHIQSHLYNPKIVSQPFANNICKSSNPRPPITGLYVFENSLYLLFLQKFQVCCTSRNSFMAIVTFYPILMNGPFLHLPSVRSKFNSNTQ